MNGAMLLVPISSDEAARLELQPFDRGPHMHQGRAEGDTEESSPKAMRRQLYKCAVPQQAPHTEFESRRKEKRI